MRVHGFWLVVAVLHTGCTGGDGGGGNSGGDPGRGDAAGGDQRLYAPCEPRSSTGTVTHVDIEVSSPLPTELGTGCAEGDPAELEGLIVFGLQPCRAAVGGSGVNGCCMDIEADQNVYAVLTYRVTATMVALAEQQKLLYLPSDSDPVVPLSFAGQTVTDMGTHRVDWCAGSL